MFLKPRINLCSKEDSLCLPLGCRPHFALWYFCCCCLFLICVGLYYTSTWISHRYTYVPRPLEPPSHLPSHPTTLCCHRAPDLSSLRPTANSHWLAILHMVVYVSMLLSVHPTLSFPRCVHKSLFLMSASPLLSCK